MQRLSIRRRGTAPLEFVMVFPFLMLLAVCIYFMARAGIVKSAAATEARNQAWALRSQADPGEPFLMREDPLKSGVEHEQREELGGQPPFGAGEYKGVSISMTLGPWFWDSKQVEFRRLTEDFSPHSEPLRLTAVNNAQTLGLLGRLRGFEALNLSGTFPQFPPQADRHRAKRIQAVAVMTRGMPQLAAAAAQLASTMAQAAASQNWLLVAYIAPRLALVTECLIKMPKLMDACRR